MEVCCLPGAHSQAVPETITACLALTPCLVPNLPGICCKGNMAACKQTHCCSSKRLNKENGGLWLNGELVTANM